MKKFSLLFGVAFVIFAMPTVTFAASPWTEKTSYGDKAVGKLEFGLKNLLGGWTELITQPKAHHKGTEIFQSIGKGVWNTLVYTVGGALHVVTFPITNVDVPLPNNGVSL